MRAEADRGRPAEQDDDEVREEIPAQTGQGGGPRSPLQLPPPDWKQSLRRAAKEFKADRGSLTAAGMAFYWFLAVFPALLAAVGVLGLASAGPQAMETITKAIREMLPGDAARVLTDAVAGAGSQSKHSSVAATVLGVTLALWSASSGMVAVQAGLDVAYDVTRERGFAKKRLVAMELIVISVVLGGVATALLVFGQPLGEILRDDLPFGSAFVLVWTAIRWLGAVVALSVLFAAFYYLAPNRDSPRWAWVSPGGVVGAVIWLLASLGFSFYVSSVGDYAKTYGSLTGVVVLLLWLFLSALAIVVGGEINAELECQGAMRSGPAPVDDRSSPPSGAALAHDSEARPPHVSEWTERMRRLRDQDRVRSS